MNLIARMLFSVLSSWLTLVNTRTDLVTNVHFFATACVNVPQIHPAVHMLLEEYLCEQKHLLI